MNKSSKLLHRLSCGLIASLLTSATALEVVAQAKPSLPATAAPPAINPPGYSFFQGLTFLPFPGTIPRPVGGINAAPLFPLVQVPTPGLVAAKKLGKPSVVKKKLAPEVEQPVRRRRRIIPKNK